MPISPDLRKKQTTLQSGEELLMHKIKFKNWACQKVKQNRKEASK